MKSPGELIRLTNQGLAGPNGSFYIDAWGKTPLNLVTHAHGDHARSGAEQYICARECESLLLARLPGSRIKSYPYGEKFNIDGAWLSFHPAGHILGSSQIRVEKNNQVLVFTGDYKRDHDPTCAPFEVVECDTLITEATFSLPIYNWQPSREIAREILEWWKLCQQEKLTALLFCYSLGKAQRIMAELRHLSDETVYVHGAVQVLSDLYRAQGVEMISYQSVVEKTKGRTDFDWQGKLIIAPPSAHRSVWMKRFKNVSTAFASGWMAVRGIRRRRGYDRGFVLSDHADWKGLLQTIQQSQASQVRVTHGDGAILSRYLSESSPIMAEPLRTEFGDEEGAD